MGERIPAAGETPVIPAGLFVGLSLDLVSREEVEAAVAKDSWAKKYLLKLHNLRVNPAVTPEEVTKARQHLKQARIAVRQAYREWVTICRSKITKAEKIDLTNQTLRRRAEKLVIILEERKINKVRRALGAAFLPRAASGGIRSTK